MVIGLEAFREAFKGYEDCYTIIGGTDVVGKGALSDIPSIHRITIDGAMMSGRKVVNGVGVLGAEHLIPFKIIDRKEES